MAELGVYLVLLDERQEDAQPFVYTFDRAALGVRLSGRVRLHDGLVFDVERNVLPFVAREYDVELTAICHREVAD